MNKCKRQFQLITNYKVSVLLSNGSDKSVLRSPMLWDQTNESCMEAALEFQLFCLELGINPSIA